MSGKTRAADLLVRSLSLAGVEKLFTLSGNQIMPIFDACVDEGIELIHVRHEAAAVHMADAWGRLTGRPGVALVTAGPGFANTLSSMYVAMAAESPLVVLSGHAPRALAGRGAFQEMAQAEMAGHVTKASWTATEAAGLGVDLARAMRTATSGRPGPVHIAIPADLLTTILPDARTAMPQADDFHPLVTILERPTADAILDQLSEADRPLVLAGPSITRGGGPTLLSELADLTGIPAIATESPRGVNDPSLGAMNEALARADLILLLGKPLDFSMRFGAEPHFDPGCRFIQLDSELRILERTQTVLDDPSRVVLTSLADAFAAVERLVELARARQWTSSDWFDEVQAAVAYRPDDWQRALSDAEGPLHPRDVCSGVQKFLNEQQEDAVFISDGGEFGQWAQAVLTAPHRLINGPSGSIGSAIPFALAARLAFPESRIVALMGDGTFGFHAMEFDTAVRYGLKFVAVVGNDACWNAERQIQLRDYGPERLIGCSLLPSRYHEVVGALGGQSELVGKPDELQPALERAFASNRPACVNVAIESLAAPTFRRT